MLYQDELRDKICDILLILGLIIFNSLPNYKSLPLYTTLIFGFSKL